MDKRTGIRQHGHAYHAEQARRALGISGDIHILSDVPLPIVHAALGIAACAVAVAIRPGAVGLRTSVIGIGALALVTGAVLIGYDLVVYPRERRPGLEGTALPVAALVAFALVLAGTLELPQRVVAGAVAVAVIGGMPHLGGLRAAGREGWITRLLRDLAGVAVLVPVLLAGVAAELPLTMRLAILVGGVTVVTFDGLRTEELSGFRALGLSFLVAGAVAAVVQASGAVTAGAGTRAALAMLLWYGLRGIASGLATGRRRFAVIAEYGFVVAVALVALRWAMLRG